MYSVASGRIVWLKWVLKTFVKVKIFALKVFLQCKYINMLICVQKSIKVNNKTMKDFALALYSVR